MDHYMLHLSYSAAGWHAITGAGAGFDDRLGPVRALIAHLGGSFAAFHFFGSPEQDRRHHVVRDKFALFGAQDLMAVLAMPDKHAAQALSIALSSQPGIAHVALTAMVPFEDTVTRSAAASAAAIAATGYAGPGPGHPPTAR